MAGTPGTLSEKVEADHLENLGHGNTPAGWTTVTILFVASFLVCLAFVISSVAVFWIGVALGVVGLIVGFVLRKAGYGVGGRKLSSHH